MVKRGTIGGFEGALGFWVAEQAGMTDAWTIWEGMNGRACVGACYDTHAILQE